tara:strand:- start:1852 stop:2448 length:597 start_codon:yes stop_codon:yes gene_type:complete
MIVIWVVLEPLLMGEPDSGLVGVALEEAYLKLASEKGALTYLLNIPGTFCIVGTMLGIAFLGKSLQGSGAAYGNLSAAIFSVLIAIPIIATGMWFSSIEMFNEGINVNMAITISMVGDSVFAGMPLFWCLGIALLGLGLVIEKGFLPIWIGGLMLVAGLVGIPGIWILGEQGFILLLITLVPAVASGVVLFMRRAQES